MNKAASHLLQMRGLKHKNHADKKHDDKSHLLQMRGLKQTRTTSPALIFSRIFYRCVD